MGFYQSDAWMRLAKMVRIKYKGICQNCGKAGTHVHHIIPVTKLNQHDPNITLNIDNLTLLCQRCHTELHHGIPIIREDLTFDSKGQVIKKPLPIHHQYTKIK